jgi:hypothetical protein
MMLQAGVLPPTFPFEDGGVAGTIATIVVIAVLLIGVAVWIWAMARHARLETGAAVGSPTREERKAA